MDISALASRLEGHTPKDAVVDGAIQEAAVAAILRPNSDPEGQDLFFIRRSEQDGDPWSGHMALPGGRMDASDADSRSAAIREVAEEVGISLDRHGRYLGRLSQVASPPMTPRVVVTPHVWALTAEVDLCLDPAEVVSGHWFSLKRLLCGEGRGSFEYRYRGDDIPLPRLDLDGHRIWGMTLRVVDDLLEQIRAVN